MFLCRRHSTACRPSECRWMRAQTLNRGRYHYHTVPTVQHGEYSTVWSCAHVTSPLITRPVRRYETAYRNDA